MTIKYNYSYYINNIILITLLLDIKLNIDVCFISILMLETANITSTTKVILIVLAVYFQVVTCNNAI